jgi:hypothetical protein
MSSAGTELESALEAFRKSQAVAYLQALSGQATERSAARGRFYSDATQARRKEALDSGELNAETDAAFCAHVARAALEDRYESARAATASFTRQPVTVGAEVRALGGVLHEWAHTRLQGSREILARAAEPSCQELAGLLIQARGRADAAAGELLKRLQPARHGDAGPEGGSRETAERWLTLTEELSTEAYAFARRQCGVEGSHGLDTLWCALGTELSGLFAREGRFRRLAADWEPLGLRALLRSRARIAPEHPGPFAAPHVLVLRAPLDVRLSPSALEFGLASELTGAEALGRVLGHVHASSTLPLALRHPSVASVARCVGQLGALRFLEPLFLRKLRGLVSRESQIVARLAAAFLLVDSRLSAASVLARGLRRTPDLEELSALAARALGGSVTPGWGALLVTRLSPGGAFRAKSLAPAVLGALREHFDEDWFANPRAAEPLAGALARGGTFSVEAWASELGCSIQQGCSRLAELF